MASADNPPGCPRGAGPDPFAYGTTIPQVFARQVARQPGAVALVQESMTVTYRELDIAADALAAEFMAGGIQPGCVVLVRMPRSPALAVVLLAILKAGAAYLAADLAWPREYAQEVLSRAGAWLATDDPRYGLDSRAGTVIVDPDGVFGRARARPVPPPSDGSAPCTVFQTSGSTGAPKLPIVPHRATVRAFVGVRYADFGPGRVIMQASPVCWDGLTMELWSVLLNGGTSLLLPDGVPVSGELLRTAAAKFGLDTVWLTSSLFSALVDDDLGAFAGLRQVMSGGERVSPEHVRRLRSTHPGIRFSSGYGPVETTVFATAHVVSDGDLDRYGEVPLGTPLPATTVHVLDGDGHPCPPGTAGEIHIGGDAVGLGYLGDPAETRNRFIRDPHRGLCYRTGDLGRWHESGILLFRGRVDRQLKIRGQRVEPEELERFIPQAMPGVIAAVTPLKDQHGQVTGLVAHCGTADPDVSAADVRSACARGLPPQLRPRRVIMHPELPRNNNGKIDYGALQQAVPAARPSSRAVLTDPSLGSAPGHIIAIASALLGGPVGLADDLFEAGGDSLFAMRLVARLRREAALTLTVGQVFRERTVARLAKIAVRELASDHDQPAGEPTSRALSPSEEDLWIHEEIFPGDPALLVLSAYQLAADLDVGAMRTALAITCARHPTLGSLRTADGAGVRLRALPPQEIERRLCVRTDLKTLAVRDGTVIFPDDWLAPFDLARDLPIRMLVTGPPGGPGQIAFVMHHVAMDGWSEHIFTADLCAAYRDVTGHEVVPPEPLASAPPASQAEREEARAYWSNLLEGAQPLPIARAQPGGGRFAERRVALTAAQVGALAALSAARRDLHAGALAWYADAVRHAFSRDDFAIGSAYAARDLVDEGSVGYHVQLIPLRISMGRSSGLADVATRISEQWLSALDQRSLSLREIAACVRGWRPPGVRPVFQAGFALQGRPPAHLDLAGRLHPRLTVQPAAPPFELYLELWPGRDGAAQALLQWDTGSLPTDVAERLAQRLLRISDHLG